MAGASPAGGGGKERENDRAVHPKQRFTWQEGVGYAGQSPVPVKDRSGRPQERQATVPVVVGGVFSERKDANR